MKVLIQQALIADPQSPLYNSTQDILIVEGVISKIGNDLSTEQADEIIQAEGLMVSPGWMDIFANFNDPGTEYKETLETGTKAAASGGYTDVMLIPNTLPVVQNKTAVEYLVKRNTDLPVQIHPIGAVSKNAEGKDLAEMYDMHASGAIAFSDGTKPLQSAGIMLKALQYVKAFDGVVIQIPDDNSIGTKGLMNEGIISTRLGLPGKPAIAEELMVERDIKLAAYTDSKVHITGVSTPASLELIKKAKAAGIKVTCSIAPYQLFFCDEDLRDYDTNLKVNPPLRTAADREILKAAVKSGLIDAIATHHLPQDNDNKIVEFEYAKAGMIGLQTAYAVVQTAISELEPAQIVQLFSLNARKIFGLPTLTIKEGTVAKLTLFSKKEWQLTRPTIESKSKNSPFIDIPLSGKVIGIIQGKKVYLNQ